MSATFKAKTPFPVDDKTVGCPTVTIDRGTVLVGTISGPRACTASGKLAGITTRSHGRRVWEGRRRSGGDDKTGTVGVGCGLSASAIVRCLVLMMLLML